MKTKTHWLMWITTTRVGRGKVWPGCAHTLDLSGISYLSLATFRQCSPLWPGLFRSFFVLFFVCFCFVRSFVCFGGKRSWYSLVFQLSNVFEPKLNAQQCLICEAFFFLFLFSKCFEHSRSWCFGSHNFFVAASHWPTATCHCRFWASIF